MPNTIGLDAIALVVAVVFMGVISVGIGRLISKKQSSCNGCWDEGVACETCPGKAEHDDQERAIADLGGVRT